jgi:hypothetical protein
MIGVEVQDHDVTVFIGEKVAYSILLRFEEELEFHSQG